jgi:Zn-dependent protease
MLIQAFSGGFDFRSFMMQLLLSIPPFILALSMHEAAHAWVANRCGDPTARHLGRLTLNPFAHIDPLGFAMLFIVGFGWAKPVPVNPNNFRSYRKDDIKVSLAGITANLLMFVVGCLMMFGMIAIALKQVPSGALAGSDASMLLRSPDTYGYSLVAQLLGSFAGYAYLMMLIFTTINLTLAVFNLLPVPPLDGYHVFNDLLLHRQLFAPRQAAMVGQIILIALIFTGGLRWLLGVVHEGALNGAGAVFEVLFRALHII